MLEKQKVITPIQASEWVSPVISVLSILRSRSVQFGLTAIKTSQCNTTSRASLVIHHNKAIALLGNRDACSSKI